MAFSDPPYPSSPNFSSARPPVIKVSAFINSVRELIESRLPLRWIAGEISNFTRAASGHCYFVLKDEAAQVRCVLFRNKAQLLDFPLRDGLQVELRAQATMYEARGEFQLNVETVRQAGQGALFEAFLRLKAKLEAMGWFNEADKRPLPAFPRAIGIVTSPKAAALRDVLTTLRRRQPRLPVILYPTAVQGQGAAAEIAAAIRTANARAEVDVLIVCRGGGSLEDLWSFNEEVVAAALYESVIPTVSGVGHETDFTICDFVADLRAPTPTGAATLATPDRTELSARLAILGRRLELGMRRRLESRMQQVDSLARRLQHPRQRLELQRTMLRRLQARLEAAWTRSREQRQATLAVLQRRLASQLQRGLPQHAQLLRAKDRLLAAQRLDRERRAGRLAALARQLRVLNPEQVLERGYAIVTDAAGQVVEDAAAAPPGSRVGIRLHRGRLEATVNQSEPADPSELAK